MPGDQPTLLVPTTQIWDAQDIKAMDTNKPEFKEFQVYLYQNMNQIAIGLNSREIGMYEEEEMVTGAQFPANPVNGISNTLPAIPRSVYRKLINIGTLPSVWNSPVTVAHGISFDSGSTLVRMYGGATDPVALSFLPLPYTSGSSPTQAIGIKADATNVTVTISPGTNYSSYTRCYVVIEYLKN